MCNDIILHIVNEKEKNMPFNTKLIEDYRKKHNLSKTAFCKKCGISLTAYKNLSGKTRMSIVIKIIDLLDISMEVFSGRK